MSFSDLLSARNAKRSRSFVAAVPGSPQDPQAGVESSSPARAHDDISSVLQLLGNLPSGIKCLRGDKTGRGIYSTTTFQPGSVIMTTVPHISILSTRYLDSHCSSCCESPVTSGLKRCTRCRQVWYCSTIFTGSLNEILQTCQNRDWSIHKSECAALQRWKASAPSVEVSVPNEAVRCLGRILWKIQKEGQSSAWAQIYNSMQSHRKSLIPSTAESHTHLAHAVVQYLGAASPAELVPFGLGSAGELVDIISRFTTNTFTLTTSSLTPIGICVSPLMALANHSCDPNAVIVFPRSGEAGQVGELPSMQLVAINDIGPDEQVLASYIDVTLPKNIRNLNLKDTYNFDCECSLCGQNAPGKDPRTWMWCPKSCGGTCAVPLEESDICRCGQCGAAVASMDIILDALRIGQEALDKATALQHRDPAKSRQITTHMVPILMTAGLTPSSYPLLAMYRLHLEQLVGSLGDEPPQDVLDITIRTAATYNAGLSNILRRGHPMRAIALAELGKLLAADEPSPGSLSAGAFPPSGAARLKLAQETLVKALDELNIAFGRANGGGEVGSEVRKLVARLEGEIGIWAQGVRSALATGNLSVREREK